MTTTDCLVQLPAGSSWPRQPTGWRRFDRTHGIWWAGRQHVDQVVYALPPALIDSCLTLYRIDAASRFAERAYAALCERHQAIGRGAEKYIRYPWLRPQLPVPQLGPLDLQALHWSAEDGAAVAKCGPLLFGLTERVQALLGRLVVSPRFLADAAALRAQWLDLPRTIRPALPIYQTVSVLPDEPDCQTILGANERKEFCGRFIAFCDQWQLVGMATWGLPIPQEPRLAPALASHRAAQRGSLGFAVPLRFALLAEDGVGPLVLDEHHQRASAAGIVDHGQWKTYESLLVVHHWTKVLQGRYRQEVRVSAFATRLTSVLAQALDFSAGRTRKLQKVLYELQTGRRVDLRGFR